MKIRTQMIGVALLVGTVLTIGSCGGGGRGRTAFKVSLLGLPAIGNPGPTYEGFALINGLGVSTGKFIVDDSVTPANIVSIPIGTILGTVNEATFGPAITQLGTTFPFIADADAWFVTLEPADDSDPAPTGNFVLGAFFVGDTAVFGNVVALAPSIPPTFIGLPSFSTITGVITAVSPTDGPGADASGLWAVSGSSGTPPGFSLPTLPGTWRYGLWATQGALTLPLGTFTQVDRADDDFMESVTRGSLSTGFAAPGQDFVSAVTTPTIGPASFNSGDWKVEVSVEPDPDNSVLPLGLTVLSGNIPGAAVNGSGVSAGIVTLTNVAPTWAASASVTPTNITISASSLSTFVPPLGSLRDGAYSVHVLIAGLLVPCGSFVVDSTGNVFTPQGAALGTTGSFSLNAVSTGLGVAFPDLAAALACTVSVVPQDLVSPRGGAGSIVLSGNIGNGMASLTMAGGPSIAAVASFATASGSCILATPTDDAPGVAANDANGVWFVKPDRRTPGLTLPSLPPGWHYAGWVVNTVTSERRPTGTFRYAANSDDDAASWPGRGLARAGFPTPGQDSVVAVPGATVSPLTFDSTWTVRVTVEPWPRVTVGPSPFTVLQGAAPSSGATGSLAVVPLVLSGQITR